jgi:putative phosphoesterase
MGSFFGNSVLQHSNRGSPDGCDKSTPETKKEGMQIKIVVLSDTHASTIDELSREMVAELQDADLIIHAGDYTGKKLFDELRSIGEFKGVYGNMDPEEIQKELPDKKIFEIEGFKIGVLHPSWGGSPLGLRKKLQSRLKEKFDLIIYGHTHIPATKERNGCLFFNPGSATGAFPAVHKTYGVIWIDRGITGRIVKA